MNKKLKLQLVILAGIMLIACLPAFGQIDGDLDFYKNQKKAFAAKSADECQKSLSFCNKVLKVIPDHLVFNYLAARLNAQLGREENAFKYLEKATKLGYTTNTSFFNIHHLNDPAFMKLRKKERFKQIIKILEKSEKPIHKSMIAFTISDKDLLPEGITYDPVEKMFYLGSWKKHKIVKVDPSDKCTDFTSEGQDGLFGILGIHVDPLRRLLWVVLGSEKRREVFKYNLSSGKFIKKYFFSTVPDGIKPFFNDLVIHPNGDVYVSAGNVICLISHSTEKMEVFLNSNSFNRLNGITLSDDGQTIYVSDFFIGIYKVDIKTKIFTLLTHEPDFNSVGVDGLYFLNNKLYCVQESINRFSLDKKGTHLISCEFFERNTPYLQMQTTGVIVDDYFYFLADTQGKGKIPGGIIVMKTPIK